jgi:hypothetical protein
MRRNKREVGTIRKNQWFFVILSLIVVGTLMTGCSKTTGSSAEKEEKRGQPYIMGEVVEVANATPTEKKKGVMGTIDIEGSRRSVDNRDEQDKDHRRARWQSIADLRGDQGEADCRGLVRRSLQRPEPLVCHCE